MPAINYKKPSNFRGITPGFIVKVLEGTGKEDDYFAEVSYVFTEDGQQVGKIDPREDNDPMKRQWDNLSEDTHKV